MPQKRCILFLNIFLNEASDDAVLISRGSLFHNVGSALLKAQLPQPMVVQGLIVLGVAISEEVQGPTWLIKVEQVHHVVRSQTM